MGVPNLEVGYTSATTGREDHEVHKGHVVALGDTGVLKAIQQTVVLTVVKMQKTVGSSRVIPGVVLQPSGSASTDKIVTLAVCQ
jgi:hypothetical protein